MENEMVEMKNEHKEYMHEVNEKITEMIDSVQEVNKTKKAIIKENMDKLKIKEVMDFLSEEEPKEEKKKFSLQHLMIK